MSGVAGLVVFLASGFLQRFDDDVLALRPQERTNPLCVDRFPTKRPFNYCKSTGQGSPEVVFLGDSQAHAIYEGVATAIGDRYPMTLLGRGGCPPLMNVPRGNTRGCNDAWETFVEYVRDVRAPLVVVVGGGVPLLQGRTAALAVHGIPFPLTEAVYKESLRALIVALQKTSDVIYVRAIAFESEPSCFLREMRLPWSRCVPHRRRDHVESRMASYNKVVDELQAEVPDLQVVDSIPALCGPLLCSQRLESGEIIYSDKLHLSSVGGRHFAQKSGLPDKVLDRIGMY